MKIDKALHAYIKAENSSMGDRIDVALEVFKLLVEQAQDDKRISMSRNLRLGDLWILIDDAQKQRTSVPDTP